MSVIEYQFNVIINNFNFSIQNILRKLISFSIKRCTKFKYQKSILDLLRTSVCKRNQTLKDRNWIKVALWLGIVIARMEIRRKPKSFLIRKNAFELCGEKIEEYFLKRYHTKLSKFSPQRQFWNQISAISFRAYLRLLAFKCALLFSDVEFSLEMS